MMFCPNCGTEIKESSKFCSSCGVDVDTESIEGTEVGKRVCLKCGAELREEEKFCSYCGVRISEQGMEKASAGARFGLYSLGDASNDMRINKWKIFGYVVATWFGVSILALIIVESQGVVWGLMSLFMGIYLATKFKEWIELVFGIVVSVSCSLPVIGMFIGIGYFARAYVDLEKARCRNVMGEDAVCIVQDNVVPLTRKDVDPSKTEETERNDSYIGVLKSKEVGQKLITILWIGLSLSGLSLLFSLLEVSVPSIYYVYFELIDGLLSLLSLLIYLISAILFFIWMYRIHFDLSNVFSDYPITPRGALARLIIPIYCIWGIWNTFATIADHFKNEVEPTIAHAGERLSSWLPFLYVTIFLSSIMFKIVLRADFSADGAPSLPVMFLALSISDVFLSVVWLQMARIIFSGMNNLVSIRREDQQQ
jgi:hypothetical protein